MDSWQSDAASHHTRQRYKEGLIQKGRDEAMEDIAMGKIQETFTSNDPKMVELRKKMFLQAGVLPQQPAGTSQPKGTQPMRSQRKHWPSSKCPLVGREGRMMWHRD